MPVTCTPSNLAELAACLKGLSPTQQEAVQTYLLCQIANNGGAGGGGSITEGAGAPVAAPSSGTGAYIDTNDGTIYWYYSGAWHP